MKTIKVNAEIEAHNAITQAATATDRRAYLMTIRPSVLRIMADLMYAPCDADLAGKAALVVAILATY